MSFSEPEKVNINALWISPASELAHDNRPVVQFRGIARLDRVPVDAELSIFAGASYKVFINGICIGSGDRGYIDRYQVLAHLKKGVNVLGVELVCGTEKPGMSLELVVNTRSGDVKYVTDDAWVCRICESVELYDTNNRPVEIVDDKGKADDWFSTRYNTKNWTHVAAEEIDSSHTPRERILPAPVHSARIPGFANAFNTPERAKDTDIHEALQIASTAEFALLKSGSVTGLDDITDPDTELLIKTPRSDKGVAIICDFDEIVDGKLEFNLETEGTGYVDVFFAQVEPADESVPLPLSELGNVRINLHKGKTTFKSLVPRKFRFVQIEFRRCSKPVALKSVAVDVTRYPDTGISKFETNKHTINLLWTTFCNRAVESIRRIWESTKDTQPLNWAEFSVVAKSGLYLLGRREIADVLLNSPGWLKIEPLDAPSLLLSYVEISGKDYEIKSRYEDLAITFRNMLDSRNSDGLYEDNSKVVTLTNLKLHRALEAMTAVAWLCGDDENALKYKDQAVELGKCIKKNLFDESKGLYCIGLDGWRKIREYPAETNLEAALSSVPDRYERRRIYHWLNRPIGAEKLSDAQIAVLVMQMGFDDDAEEALELLRNTVSSAKQETGLVDVIACAGICLISGIILGIRPVLGSIGRYSISPERLGLKQVDGDYIMPEGNLFIGWRGTKRGLMIQVDVPNNSRYDLYLNSRFGDIFRIGGRRLAGGCASLSPGKHRVHCSQEIVKKTASDPTLAPETPWTNIEVLDAVAQYGIHSRKGRSLRSKHRDEEENPSDISTVESIELNEPETENAALGADQQAVTEVVEERKSRRRKRSKSRKPVEKAAEVSEVEPVDESKETATDANAEPVSEIPTERKSRRRRRGRGRKGIERSSETVEEVKIETPEVVVEEEEFVQEQAVEPPVEVVSEHKSHRKRRRNRKSAVEQPETQVETVDEVQSPIDSEISVSEEPVQVVEEQGEEHKTKHRRRRNRSRRPVEITTDLAVEEVAEPTAVEAAVVSETEHEKETVVSQESVKDTEQVESRKPRRHRRNNRRKSGDVQVEPVESTEAEPAVEPQHEEPVVEEIVEASQRPRRRRGRAGKVPVEQSSAVGSGNEETPVSPDESEKNQEPVVEQKPKPRHRSTRKSRQQSSPVEEFAQNAENAQQESIPEISVNEINSTLVETVPEPVAPGTEKKPRRRSARKPETAEASQSDESEQAEDKPKRTIRRRNTRRSERTVEE